MQDNIDAALTASSAMCFCPSAVNACRFAIKSSKRYNSIFIPCVYFICTPLSHYKNSSSSRICTSHLAITFPPSHQSRPRQKPPQPLTPHHANPPATIRPPPTSSVVGQSGYQLLPAHPPPRASDVLVPAKAQLTPSSALPSRLFIALHLGRPSCQMPSYR